MVFKETTVNRMFTSADAQKFVSRSMRYDSEIILEYGNKTLVTFWAMVTLSSAFLAMRTDTKSVPSKTTRYTAPLYL